MEELDQGLVEAEIANGGTDFAIFDEVEAVSGHTGHDFFVGIDFADIPDAGDEEAAIGGGDHFFDGGIASAED